ncbi:hypothetical protein CH341_17935 [Rhodoplanes roseus]|uniref:Uncharacterized protein n=1 Tax=Rhodoplanes roseus TaxID=29409 RepID=A0A327KXG8_9BRAD|nr:hypothetical protein CH341_17935 [Rhodoplanes roseus]
MVRLSEGRASARVLEDQIDSDHIADERLRETAIVVPCPSEGRPTWGIYDKITTIVVSRLPSERVIPIPEGGP